MEFVGVYVIKANIDLLGIILLSGRAENSQGTKRNCAMSERLMNLC